MLCVDKHACLQINDDSMCLFADSTWVNDCVLLSCRLNESAAVMVGLIVLVLKFKAGH